MSSIQAGFTGSNIYDAASNRQSNLEYNLDSGVTVEFWLKKYSFQVGDNTQKEVIFDLWNGKPSGSEQYGRLTIFLSGTANDGAATGDNADPFRIQLASGSDSNANVWDLSFGYSSSVTTASLTSSGWTHYAFSFHSSSDDAAFKARFYVNGVLKETAATSSVDQWGEITGSMIAYLGALQTAPYTITDITASADMAGYGKLSASMDEFRYWKSRRTSKDIGLNWFTQVGGGTNEDIANAELGVYYKFNEGITGTSSVDATVLDYSGRVSNGLWISGSVYGGSGGNSRNIGSAIVSASAATEEFRDPIIYKEHAEVANLYAELQSSGSAHDYLNNSSIYYTLPTWILDEDSHEDKRGEILNLTQIIASYFDQLHLQIREVPEIKDISYTSSSLKPYPFSNRLLENAGMAAPEIFVDSDIISLVMSKDKDRIYEEELSDIKNLIYQNIYNNLSYIYKSKGTEKSLRNLIRCYGVDDELIKINLYGDNATYKIEDNRKDTAVRKHYVNFNAANKFSAVVVQQSSSDNSNTTSITNVSGTYAAGTGSLASTVECEIIFPKKFFRTPFLTSSLFGWHGIAGTTSKRPEAFVWPTNANAYDLQVFAIRPEIESKDAYFLLTSSKPQAVPVRLTSSLFKDIYDDQKWVFAIRVKPKKAAGDLTSGSMTPSTGDDSEYTTIEFYGINTELGVTQNEFFITSSSTNANSANYNLTNRRYYIGAYKENWTGSLVYFSDIEASSLRHWMSYVDNDTVKAHAKDPLVYGPKHPYRNSHLLSVGLTGSKIPQIDTLILNWDFKNITGSNASGEMVVSDF